VTATGTGTVWFIGAGPGDPELITVKGQHLARDQRARVDDEVGLADEPLALDRDELRVARTRADEPNRAGACRRHPAPFVLLKKKGGRAALP